METRPALARLGGLGYSMPGVGGATDAVYLPHLNQIWLDDPNEDAGDHAALPHELYHLFSSSAQPSMLLPLRDYLIGRLDDRVFQCFEDIVEPLALVTVPTLAGEPLDPARLTAYPEEHVEMLGRLLDLADHLAALANPAAESPMVEAMRAVAFALLHVFSYRPGTGRYLVEVLRRRKKWDEWTTRWDLFFQLHEALRRKYEESPRAQARYHLSHPVDAHRSVGESLVFLSGALRAAEEQPDLFVGAIPSLLTVLSMGSFTILPVISLSGDDGAYRGTIRVIHSTRRGERAVKNVIDTQMNVTRLQAGAHSDCEAIPCFVGVIKQLEAARVSASTERIAEAIRELLRLAAGHAARITRSRTECPGCRAVFRDHTVAAAGHHVALMPEAQRRAFVAGAEGFEQWLRERCMREVLGPRVGEAKFRTVKRYRYL